MIIKNKIAKMIGKNVGLVKIINIITNVKMIKLNLFTEIPLIIIKVANIIKKEQIVSVSIQPGQVIQSGDIINKGIHKDIIIGLIPRIRRLFENSIKEKKTKDKLNIKKTLDHSSPKKNFANDIKSTGIV